jgi:hypothetical protein
MLHRSMYPVLLLRTIAKRREKILYIKKMGCSGFYVMQRFSVCLGPACGVPRGFRVVGNPS